jgi:hypothetical protein
MIFAIALLLGATVIYRDVGVAHTSPPSLPPQLQP